MPRDNGTVRLRTLRRDLVARMVMIADAQRSGSSIMIAGTKELPRIARKHNQQQNIANKLPDDLPFKYIVEGSSINPGSPVHYETDTLLTESDRERMTKQENLKIIMDKGPWTWS